MTLRINKKFWAYILVLFAILCSGTVIFNIKYNSVFIPIFIVIAGICNATMNQGKVRLQQNKLTVVILLVFLFINSLVHSFDGVALNGVVQIALYIVGVYLITNAIGFGEYRRVYIDVVVVLSVISLIVLFCVNTGILSAHKEIINGKGFLISSLHVVGWENTIFRNRLCGLFHEPGMFQIIINIAILYSLDEIIGVSDFSGVKKQLFQIIILIITLLETRSTAGYLVFGFEVVYFLWKKRKTIRNKFLKILYWSTIPIFGVVMASMLKSDVVVSKLQSTNISFSIRMNDFISGIKMIFLQPILGLGYESKLYYSSIEEYGIDSMSNGIFNIAIMLGVPFIICVLVLLIRNMRRQKWNVSLIIVLFVFVIQGLVESWFFFPVSLAFLFSWKEQKENVRREYCE